MASQQKKRKNGYPKGIFRETFVSANQEMSPFGMVFVYPPENFDQAQLGTIFGIIKITDTSPESSFVANLLASVIKKEFFGKPGRPSFDSFEASLKKANLALAELARQGSVKWIGKISFAGGVLEKNNLHFSKLGTTDILLLRSGALADIGSGLEADAPENDAHPLKTFSDISSGKIESGDCLIFATSDLLEIFSLEEVRQNAARFSREEFPDIIFASLTANSELSGAIVVNIAPTDEPEAKIEKVSAVLPTYYPPQRMNRPRTIPPAVSPQSPSPVSLSAKSKDKIYISESDDILGKKSFGKKSLLFAAVALQAAKNAAFTALKGIHSLFQKINWRKIYSSAMNFQSWLKKNTRVASAAGGIIVLAIFAFVFFKNTDNTGRAEPAGQPVSGPTSENTPSAASNETNAKNIENISQVAALPPDSRELVLTDDSIFVLNADKSILKINSASGETENMTGDIAGGKFTLAAAMPDLNTIFILTEDKKVISFTPINKKFQENTIALPENVRAAGLKTFLTYIYVLDPTANQIYRYPRAEGGFGERQDWLKTGADVKNATNFAINEDLFVADRNQITAFLQGKKKEMSFEAPTAPLSIDKIFTAPDLENIYVLDNKNHRVVRYEKDGKIAAQYWSASIAGIKDFTVDEKNKIIYLQKTDSIWKFSME